MPHKKRSFNKGNSEKFLLLRGSSQAVNADGETLQNVLVPVSKNYKSGTSLLMPNIAALSNLEEVEDTEEHKDIEGVFDDASIIDDSSVAEDIVEGLLSDMKKLKCSKISSNVFDTFDNDTDDNYSDADENNYSDDETNCIKQKNPINDKKCSENWKMFNEKFDKILEEYEDDDIGSLDGEEDIGDHWCRSPKPFFHDIELPPKESEIALGDYDDDFKEKILNYADDDSEEKFVEIVTVKPLEYDCESILSTYSNKYNHPTIIKEEKISRSRTTSYTSHEIANDESHTKLLTVACNIRKKGETSEEKKERQRMFKEAKRLRRELKKQNKEAFKEEKKYQSSKELQSANMKLL